MSSLPLVFETLTVELKDRLVLARKAAGLSQGAVAEIVGITQGAYSQLETGKANTTAFIGSIAAAFKVNALWLERGEGAMHANVIEPKGMLKNAEFKEWTDGDEVPEGYVEVDYLNETFASAGNGYANQEQYESKHLWFRKETLLENNVVPNAAKCFVVAGKSMWPEIDDKQVISIDTSATRIFDGEIYLVAIGDELKVKIVTKWNGDGIGGIKLISRNEDKQSYPDEYYSPAEIEAQGIRIIGQYWWKSEVRRVRR